MKAYWHKASLEDICVVDWGNTNLTKTSYIEGGKYLAVSAAGCDGRINHKEHSKCTPVLSAIGAQCGKMFFPEEDFTAIKNTITLTPIEGKCNGKFLYYLLTYIELPKRGAGQPFISKGDIQAFVVDTPPLPEQQRIVKILDKAFEGLAIAKANAEKNLLNARALFESYLNSVFTKRGEGWEKQRLGDLVERLTNGYVGPTRNIYQKDGIPYLLARHVRNNRLLFDGITFISNEFNQKNKKSILKVGDVLLVQSGHIGHSAVVSKNHAGHNCHAMIVITPKKGVLNGPFLSYFFLSSDMQQRFEKIRSGSTVPHLTCGAVKEESIPLPDLLTQQQVVSQLEEMESETRHLEGIYEQKKDIYDDLKKSLLHQAFQGEL